MSSSVDSVKSDTVRLLCVLFAVCVVVVFCLLLLIVTNFVYVVFTNFY